MKRQLTAVSLVLMMGVACGEGGEQPSSPVCNEAPALAPQPLADLPVINEAQVTRQGCRYSIKVLQDVDPDPYPHPFHRIIVQSEVVSPSTCTLVPSTVELATSGYVPEIAIGANAEGVVVAYSPEWYRRPYVNAHIGIQRLDPNTLCALRVTHLVAGYQSENGLGGGPGRVYLEELTLHPSFIGVSGTFNGNTIYETPRIESPSAYPNPIVQGSRFVATYPDFFGTTQRPPFLGTF